MAPDTSPVFTARDLLQHLACRPGSRHPETPGGPGRGTPLAMRLSGPAPGDPAGPAASDPSPMHRLLLAPQDTAGWLVAAAALFATIHIFIYDRM